MFNKMLNISAPIFGKPHISLPPSNPLLCLLLFLQPVYSCKLLPALLPPRSIRAILSLTLLRHFWDSQNWTTKISMNESPISHALLRLLLRPFESREQAENEERTGLVVSSLYLLTAIRTKSTSSSSPTP